MKKSSLVPRMFRALLTAAAVGIGGMSAPLCSLYFNSGPDNTGFGIWLLVVRQGDRKSYG